MIYQKNKLYFRLFVIKRSKWVKLSYFKRSIQKMLTLIKRLKVITKSEAKTEVKVEIKVEIKIEIKIKIEVIVKVEIKTNEKS